MTSLIDNCKNLCDNTEKGMDEDITEEETLSRRLVFILKDSLRKAGDSGVQAKERSLWPT